MSIFPPRSDRERMKEALTSLTANFPMGYDGERHYDPSVSRHLRYCLDNNKVDYLTPKEESVIE